MRSETFEWAGPVVGSRIDAGASGVAYLSGIRDGLFAAPPIDHLVSAEILAVEHGRVQLLCSAASSQFGLLGELDPGVAHLLVNAAITCVAESLTDGRHGWSTTDSSARYVVSVAPRVGVLMATAEVLESSPAGVVVRGELADVCGRLVMTVVTTLAIFELESGPGIRVLT